MFKKADIVLVAVLVLVSIAGFAAIEMHRAVGAGQHRIAVIRQNNKVIKTIDLDALTEPVRIEVSGEYHDFILAEKGRIRFEDADCPDRICVKTGWRTRIGDMAVCVPNRTSIKIEGQNDKVDGVAY